MGVALKPLCQEPHVPGVEKGLIWQEGRADVVVLSSFIYTHGGDSPLCHSPGERDAICQPGNPSGELDTVLAHHPDPHKALSAGGTGVWGVAPGYRSLSPSIQG